MAEQGERQTTIGAAVSMDGVGLHGGRPCRMTLLPAPADTGIVWRRADLPGAPEVPASAEFVVDTTRATSIGRGAAAVRTVEHVMAALRALRIDNAVVQLDGEEPPFADGAAAAFVRLIRRAGTELLDAPRRARPLRAPAWAAAGDAYIVALPADEFRVTYTFVSDHPALGTQFADFSVDPDVFETEIAPARTVGWLHEVEALRRRGLGLGITKDAAVVVDETGFVSPMRMPDEVARHKVLDIVGDLALAGPLAGVHVMAVRSGHALHVELAKKIQQQFMEEDAN